jgi:hypothetical protein
VLIADASQQTGDDGSGVRLGARENPAFHRIGTVAFLGNLNLLGNIEPIQPAESFENQILSDRRFVRYNSQDGGRWERHEYTVPIIAVRGNLNPLREIYPRDNLHFHGEQHLLLSRGNTQDPRATVEEHHVPVLVPSRHQRLQMLNLSVRLIEAPLVYLSPRFT